MPNVDSKKMLDSKNKLDSKNEIALRFYKAKKTYALNTPIQALMRNELIEILKQNITQKSFENVFEFGARSGEYTRLLRQHIESKRYVVNDICDYEIALSGVERAIFDMNEIAKSHIFTQKFDLITSNATLQWLNFNATLQNLAEILNENGVILCSTFGVQNLIEIKKTTGYGLDYEPLNNIEKILKTHFKKVILYEKIYTLRFQNALEIFRHLKLSGVNSCGFSTQDSNQDCKDSKQIIIKKSWLEDLKNNFHNKITYHCIFFLARK